MTNEERREEIKKIIMGFNSNFQSRAEIVDDIENLFPKWIPCSERLPEAGKRVIIPGGVGFHMSGIWYSIVDEGNRNPRILQWSVTHWQELPSNP